MANGILDLYFNNLMTALNELNAAKSAYDIYKPAYDQKVNDIASINPQTHPVEYNRLQTEWAEVLAPKFNKLTYDLQQAKIKYDDALAKYEQAKSELASPAELQAHEADVIAQAQLNAANAQAMAAGANAKLSETEAAALKKKIINYSIIGAITITVILVGWWAYKKYFKKS